MRMRLMVVVLAVVGAALSGCSSEATVRDRREGYEKLAEEAPAPLQVAAAQPVPHAAPVPAASTLDPKAYAASFPRASECEPAARALKAQSADVAWSVLKACVEQGNFTALKRLVDGAWDKDLQTRRDASLVLAKVIAARGGDVDGDLALLRQRRVPLFALGAALAQPDTYKGRLVLVRGKVVSARTMNGVFTVALNEMGLGAQSSDIETGPASSSTYSARGSFNAEASSTNYGSASVSGSGGYASTSRWVQTERRHSNVSNETGREALGRLAKPDPFLEPGKELVLLTRFDGVRTTSHSSDTEEEQVETVGVLSIIAYVEPSPLVIE